MKLNEEWGRSSLYSEAIPFASMTLSFSILANGEKHRKQQHICIVTLITTTVTAVISILLLLLLSLVVVVSPCANVENLQCKENNPNRTKSGLIMFTHLCF